MTVRWGIIATVAAAGLLIAAAACASDVSTPPDRGPAGPTPNAQATITALAQAVQFGTPTPTPAPVAARAAAQRFASQFEALSEDWDQAHLEFDEWRNGLAACTASHVTSALGRFASQSASITEAARSLPRPQVVRDLSDKLIEAAELEETALRQLRDTRQPNRGAIAPGTAPTSKNGPPEVEDGAEEVDAPSAGPPVSAFEEVAFARSSAAELRKLVADALNDRSSATEMGALAKIEAFAAMFQEVEASWDQFNQDYDALRNEAVGLSREETSARAGALIDQFRSITVAIRNLPPFGATREVAELLGQTATRHDLALRRLRGGLTKSSEVSSKTPENKGKSDGDGSEAPNTPLENGEKSGEAGSEASNNNPDSGAAESFDNFDSQLVSSNAARTTARKLLAQARAEFSEETEARVGEFVDAYEDLVLSWDKFHDDYDQWRQVEGGCDRSQAIQALGGFSGDFGLVANAVRDLDAAAVLRSMGELLVQAAEREERALKELRDKWQPYDAGIYQAYDSERQAAGKLRRQVAVSLQQLLERFGVTSQ